MTKKEIMTLIHELRESRDTAIIDAHVYKTRGDIYRQQALEHEVVIYRKLIDQLSRYL